MAESLRYPRKFSQPRVSASDIPRAKAAKSQSWEFIYFVPLRHLHALREILQISVAAMSCQVKSSPLT
ncbi:MAG: hypothetical protein ACXWWP_10740, partial [Candidatus Binatia bacterium]